MITQQILSKKNIGNIDYVQMLRKAKLRPTRQRLFLLKLLYRLGNCHISAESLYAECHANKANLSLATVYNCLHHFASAGFIQSLEIQLGKVWYDTNLENHHHFYDEETDSLIDIPEGEILISSFPAPPAGKRVKNFNLVLRLENVGESSS